MKKNTINVSILLLSMFLVNCIDTKPTIETLPLTCNSVEIDSSSIDSISIKKIPNIKFYFENSGSMKGYLKSSNFKDVVSNLIVKLNGKEDKDTLNLYTIASIPIPYEKQPEIFIEELANGNVPLRGFSTMHEIFKVMLDKSMSNDINFFVSDCILSYSNEDIRRNPNINVESVSELKNQLLNVVQENANENDFSFSVFAFKSDFDGTYYDYQNVKIIDKFTNRPYYIWVFGKKENVREISTWINSLDTFKNNKKEEIFFNEGVKVIEDHRIIKKPGKSGYRLTVDNKSLKDVEKDSISFYVALNLECLPSRLSEISFLKENLIVKALDNPDKSTVEILNIYDYQELMENEKISHPGQKAICEQATHFVQISLKNVLSKERVNIQLQGQIPDWYKEWSIMDDSNVDANFDKTFGFEWLVNGVSETYSENKNLEITININKN